jgi:hypothetical protein
LITGAARIHQTVVIPCGMNEFACIVRATLEGPEGMRVLRVE